MCGNWAASVWPRVTLAAAAFTFLPPVGVAAALPDCHVSATIDGAPSKSVARYSLLVDGALKNGVTATYAKEEPVLSTPVKVVRSVAAYTVTGDMKLHSSWALNPDYRFTAGQMLKVDRQLSLRDGRTFDVVILSNGSILFVNDQGEFCNCRRLPSPPCRRSC